MCAFVWSQVLNCTWLGNILNYRKFNRQNCRNSTDRIKKIHRWNNINSKEIPLMAKPQVLNYIYTTRNVFGRGSGKGSGTGFGRVQAM